MSEYFDEWLFWETHYYSPLGRHTHDTPWQLRHPVFLFLVIIMAGDTTEWLLLLNWQWTTMAKMCCFFYIPYLKESRPTNLRVNRKKYRRKWIALVENASYSCKFSVLASILFKCKSYRLWRFLSLFLTSKSVQCNWLEVIRVYQAARCKIKSRSYFLQTARPYTWIFAWFVWFYIFVIIAIYHVIKKILVDKYLVCGYYFIEHPQTV